MKEKIKELLESNDKSGLLLFYIIMTLIFTQFKWKKI